MTSARMIGRVKRAALAGLLAGGTVFGASRSAADIQKNVVAGTLTYVKNSTTTFWNSLVPQTELWEGFFNPTPME